MKNNLAEMVGLDIYLSSLSLKEYKEIAPEIESDHTSTPLLSWDIYSGYSAKKLADLKKAREIEAFKKFAEKFQFQNNFDQIFSSHDFEALVITNLNKEIVWVSNGFKEMTGYSKKFALTQTPAFLQGKDTSLATKKIIRQKLNAQEKFSEIVINYKKDKTPYKCLLNVFPLFNEETTHFLALEKQVA